MDRLEQASFYADLNGLDTLRQGALNNDKKALRKAAEHFESVFMNMLMKNMRAANDVLADEDSPFNGKQVKFYRDMQDNQMAMELSSKGALGIADIIVQQLSPEKNNYMPAESLRQDPFSQNQKSAMTNPIAGNEPVRLQQSLLSLGQNDKPEQTEQKQATFGKPDVFNQLQQQISQQQSQLSNNPLTTPTAQTKEREAVDFKDKRDFIDKLMPIAKKVAGALGLPPVAMVAQAALETGWGQKMMQATDGLNALNFFGIKADSRWPGEATTTDTKEYRNGVAQTEQAQFRVYDSMEDGLRDYVSFISDSPRYQQAIQSAANPQAYFDNLQKAGYATDPNYASKIMKVMQDPAIKAASVQ